MTLLRIMQTFFILGCSRIENIGVFHPLISSDEINGYKQENEAKYLIIKPNTFKIWMMRLKTARDMQKINK